MPACWLQTVASYEDLLLPVISQVRHFLQKKLVGKPWNSEQDAAIKLCSAWRSGRDGFLAESSASNKVPTAANERHVEDTASSCFVGVLLSPVITVCKNSSNPRSFWAFFWFIRPPAQCNIKVGKKKQFLDILGSSLGWVFQKPSLRILRAFSVRHDVVVIDVLFVFGGLPDNFLGIAKWVLGFGNSCCPQSPKFAGHGSSEGPRCAEADAVIQWDQRDLQMALVRPWTLQWSSGAHVVCQPFPGRLQQGIHGPHLCLQWSCPCGRKGRPHQDDMRQLAVPKSTSRGLLQGPNRLCRRWVVHGHHAWEVGSLGDGQEWSHTKLWAVRAGLHAGNWRAWSSGQRWQCDSGSLEADPWCNLWQLHRWCGQWYWAAWHLWGWDLEAIPRALREVSSWRWELHSNLANAWAFCQCLRATCTHRWSHIPQRWNYGATLGVCARLGLHWPQVWCVALHLR